MTMKNIFSGKLMYNVMSQSINKSILGKNT